MNSSDPELGIKKHPSLKKRKKTSLLKRFFVDYTQSTTLHGLKYTTENGIHTIEKIFWAITFILSLGMCLFQIRNVWHKWQTSPVIVSFSEKIVPVEMVPFPSLTICPQIKAKATYYNYTEHMLITSRVQNVFSDNSSTMEPTETPSDEDIKKFLDVSLICPLPNYRKPVVLDGYPKVTNKSTITHILDVSPKLDDYFFGCRWSGNDRNCKDLFSTVLTEEGVCFNFNGLAANEIFRFDNIQRDYEYNNAEKNSSDWDINMGYNNNEDVDYLEQYPYRGQYDSHDPYLGVTFATDKHDYDQNCNILYKGFKVYIQHPANQPQSSVYSYAVLPGQVSALAMTVNMMNTSEKLVKYDSKIRQCFFETEKYLKYFKLYTASNCMLECMSNYTYQQCQCVPFHMPHSNSTYICTQQSTCLRQSRGFGINFTKYTEKCNCLPNCNSIKYNAEVLKTEFNLKQLLKNFVDDVLLDDDSDFDDYIRRNEFSKLEVYYRDSGFVTITRSELYGITDFLANIGGLLGLFLGFSFLSIIEIVYFFTFRLGFFFNKDIKNENPMEGTTASEPTHAENDDIATIKIKLK